MMNIRAIISLLILAPAVPALAKTTPGTDIPVTPSGDAVYYHAHWRGGAINEWQPSNTSEGASYYGDSGDVAYTRTFLQLDLTSLTAPVASAQLFLNLTSVYAPDTIAGFLKHSPLTSGNGDATQGISGDQLVHTFTNGQPLGWTAFDVTSLINQDIAKNFDYACFYVEFQSYYGSGPSGVSFDAAESGSGPFLRTVPVPEPASLSLLALAALPMIAKRRRA